MKITLCGSTRFMSAFGDWNVILTKAGHQVYTLCQNATGGSAIAHDPKVTDKNEAKRRFDLVHLKKISESDAIVVLNVDGYVGDSTLREIEWARMERKDVYWLENKPKGKILGVSIWSLQNLFEDAPISSIIESKAYDL